MDSGRLRERVERRLQEQRELVRSLLLLREQLRGSLFTRYGECGKPTCACSHGEKHGPYYVLSTRSAGKGGYAYLAADQAREAKELVARYRAFRAGLRKLKRINEDLVVLLRRYQESGTRVASRRLGLPIP
jgi:Family of unknown function (DUF6788)